MHRFRVAACTTWGYGNGHATPEKGVVRCLGADFPNREKQDTLSALKYFKDLV